jgi:Uma2 family endonuclease
VPDLIFEVRSKSVFEKLRDKIQVFLELDTSIVVLVDVRTRTMEVFRSGQEMIVLRDGDILTVPELLPG